MPYCYDYPRPSVTTDIIVINAEKKVLLIKRLNEPFKNFWAFPGGFVDKDEDIEPAALRELMEETSLGLKTLTQFKAYGTPGRDPRGHCISIVFYKFTNNLPIAKAQDDAKEVAWFNLENLPELAFDHQQIIKEFKSFIKKERLL